MHTPNSEYGDERNPAIKAFLEDYHAFAIPVLPFEALPGEALLDSSWTVLAEDPEFALCAEDMAEFLQRMNRTSKMPASDERAVRLQRGGAAGRPVVSVSVRDVRVRAATLRDAWQAVVWLERRMAVRHAPALSTGETTLSPAYDMRITTAMFTHGFELPQDPVAYTEPYLRSMTHMGYTAFFLYLNLWDFTRSALLTELDSPEGDRNLAALGVLGERARRYGLDVVLLINTPRIQPTHLLFSRRPELKGGIVMRESGHALCTSEPLTREFYAEQVQRLCRGVPGLGALAFLIGGEGFLHCYTRPVPRTDRVTNCPRCGQRAPSQVLLPLLNRIVGAVKDVSPGTRVVFWPYSSFIWQKQTKESYDWSEDLAVIRGLDPRATWLIEIEKDAPQDVEGVGRVAVWDYGIQYVGPSPKMQLESAALRQRGIELAVKTETNLSVELHSAPYLPVMFRWARRHRAIQQTGGRVTWESWRFTGFWPSPSVEVAYWLATDPGLTDEQALERIAERLYGPSAVPKVMNAWRMFSDAWETFYVIYGVYWFGPLVLGPAHPMDDGTSSHLPRAWSDRFYQVLPGWRETESGEFLNDPRNRSPKFLILPEMHQAARVRDLRRVSAGLARGLLELEEALPSVPATLRAQAQADVDMARTVAIIVDEDIAFNEFVVWRDRLRCALAGAPEQREAASAVAALLAGSISRAETALAIMRRNDFIGWGYTYGIRFSSAMIEEKLSRTRAYLENLKRSYAHLRE